ncbi:MAG: hypothetical protein K0Q79_2021 [Flavipsychrobacter sp.]|jgi:hypothetical protein|nr:hypothetical protein [Flavipsychrobacter sp.]
MKRTLLLLLLLFVLIAACKKSKERVIPATPVDTLTLLTAHRWYVDYIWNDGNNNGLVDTPLGEIKPGTLNYTAYTFLRNGGFIDSIPNKILYGTWYFKGATKDSVYITIDTIGNYLHSIQSISGTNMVTKRWGSLERWYFVKF